MALHNFVQVHRLASQLGPVPSLVVLAARPGTPLNSGTEAYLEVELKKKTTRRVCATQWIRKIKEFSLFRFFFVLLFL